MVLLAVIAGLVGASYVVETLRKLPAAPERLPWAPDLPVRFVDVDGLSLRYVVDGDGPPLVLLHTLRTQLDMYQRVLPGLAGRFRVFAVDLPGHGWSDIPLDDLAPELFVRTIAGFLDRLDVRDAVVVGESIGGTIALLLAARRHPRVRRVVAVNPYDYDRGRGLRRSSALANVLFGLDGVPLLGATIHRLRRYEIFRKVLEGGVVRRDAVPDELAREMYAVGNRPGHARAFRSLVRRWPDWERARSEYGRIAVPAVLLYGEDDWSRSEERATTARAVPGARMRLVEGAGHFLSLDAPAEIVRAVLDSEDGRGDDEVPPVRLSRGHDVGGRHEGVTPPPVNGPGPLPVPGRWVGPVEGGWNVRA
jgi:pimeloyl-ACP methyl ester carboxylesterase